jgi:pimeloyl-[acyl-carrier protein] methyl ester esterase
MLHQATVGNGPNLVLLHGWGMSSSIWGGFQERLQQRFRVTSIDLPGHGQSQSDSAWCAEDVVEQLLKQLPDKFSVLGWSLGGMLALKLTSCSQERVEKLIMMASSAKFVQAENWKAAQTKAVMQQFSEQLEQDAAMTIKRFASLQAQGTEASEKITRQLRAILAQAPKPSLLGLKSGLSVLETLDLRDKLSDIKTPILMLLGEHDQLVPQAVGHLSQTFNSAVKTHIVKDAAHVPFMSHQDETYRTVEQFLQADEYSTSDNRRKRRVEH